MNILITGATGFIGQYVTRHAIEQGHQVTVVTRSLRKAQSIFANTNLSIIEHDLLQTPLEAGQFTNIEAVINLMGENIADKRWTKNQKQLLVDSRIISTRNLLKNIPDQIESIASASALGIYAPNQAAHFWTEDSPANNDFLGELCVKWEREVSSLSKRSIFIRIGAAIGKEGGILKPLLPVFKMGLGGPIGSGQQLMSWMHVKDIARLFVFSLENKDVAGAFNAVVGEPITNKHFSKALASALKRPALLPVPPFMLKIVLGSELGAIALENQAAISEKLHQIGFRPQYQTIEEALQNL